MVLDHTPDTDHLFYPARPGGMGVCRYSVVRGIGEPGEQACHAGDCRRRGNTDYVPYREQVVCQFPGTVPLSDTGGCRY